MHEWVAAYRCSRCQHNLRFQVVEISDEGRFELKDFPNECTNQTCQAGFGADTDYTLVVSMYQRWSPRRRPVYRRGRPSSHAKEVKHILRDFIIEDLDVLDVDNDPNSE